MIREESTGFIGTKIGDVSYDFHLKEGIFPTSCEEILVLHKKQLKMMRPQEVGDGMLVFQTKEKAKNPIDRIDISSVVGGMCIYEWFDENSGKNDFFAYGFDRDKIEWVQEVCKILKLPIKIHEEKFVRIEVGEYYKNMIIEDFSYFFGLALIYGHFDFGEDGLKHVKIHLPLEGSIAQSEERIKSMVESLHKDWLYITYNYQDQKNGQILQINCSDREVLNVWSVWLGGTEYSMSEYVDTISGTGFLGSDLDLSNYVLKFLHK